jgi:predicted NBD/HSP70 family sugar kinase
MTEVFASVKLGGMNIHAALADRVTPETMAAATRDGDEATTLALIRAGEWLGIGAANMVSALHPELVVIAGGVALATRGAELFPQTI